MTIPQIDASEGMIERIETASRKARTAYWGDIPPLVDKQIVKAVLTALREPTPGMIEAAAHDAVWDDADSTPSTEIAAALWRAQIDHILTEREG